MSKKIAIMQPTYLPWLGYLAMVEKVDQFVFLDNVQFDHRSWQQRNRIKTSDGELWLTLSVRQKGQQDQKIQDVMCLDLAKDIKKHLASMVHAYKKSKNYDVFFPMLAEHINNAMLNSKDSLSEFNMSLVQFLCSYVGINTEFIRASMIPVTGAKEILLANICEYLGADKYLSPPGSKVYLDDSDIFKSRAISIDYHVYNHPEYPQLHGAFIPCLSSIDAFMNVSQDELYDLIMLGCL